MQVGLLCVGQEKLLWKGGRLDISSDELSDIFREQLEKANYKVVGNSNALFDDPSEWKSEFLIGGLVTEMGGNVCYPKAGFSNYSSVKGEFYTKVNWQIYAKLDRRVVYETTTEGSYIADSTLDGGSVMLLHNAFSVAVNNLLADKGFHDLITGATKTDSGPSFEQLKITRAPAFKAPITEHINDVRSATVTVLSGKSHGSGFFIDSNGYLLTNQHVVGESKLVKIKLVTGREILGEIVRTNRTRDIALIKVEEKQFAHIPILDRELSVGEEVYSIGSPLDEKLSTTVSKGIVSGYREENSIKFIQSDVNVLPGGSGGCLVDSKGNLVGITVKGYMIQGAPVGLNFFIPVNDALKALNIKIAEK